MATGTEPIRQDIDAIRDSMTVKMEQIESKVKGTVDNTVETVKRTFDIKEQVSDRPWAAMGIAVVAGYVLGNMGGSSDDIRRNDAPRNDYRPGEAVAYFNQAASDKGRSGESNGHDKNERQSFYAPAQPQQPGFLDGIMDQFGDEIETIKTAAISAATTMLRDMVKQNLPQFNESYERARRERGLSSDTVDNSKYAAYPDTASALDRELRNNDTPTVVGGGRDELFKV